MYVPPKRQDGRTQPGAAEKRSRCLEMLQEASQSEATGPRECRRRPLSLRIHFAERILTLYINAKNLNIPTFLNANSITHTQTHSHVHLNRSYDVSKTEIRPINIEAFFGILIQPNHHTYIDMISPHAPHHHHTHSPKHDRGMASAIASVPFQLKINVYSFKRTLMFNKIIKSRNGAPTPSNYKGTTRQRQKLYAENKKSMLIVRLRFNCSLPEFFLVTKSLSKKIKEKIQKKKMKKNVEENLLKNYKLYLSQISEINCVCVNRRWY